MIPGIYYQSASRRSEIYKKAQSCISLHECIVSAHRLLMNLLWLVACAAGASLYGAPKGALLLMVTREPADLGPGSPLVQLGIESTGSSPTSNSGNLSLFCLWYLYICCIPKEVQMRKFIGMSVSRDVTGRTKEALSTMATTCYLFLSRAD